MSLFKRKKGIKPVKVGSTNGWSVKLTKSEKKKIKGSMKKIQDS